MSDHKAQNIQWQPIIEMAMVIFTTLGTTIALYLHTDSKIDLMNQNATLNRQENTQILLGIQAEIKDFHGKLCAIEERNKK